MWLGSMLFLEEYDVKDAVFSRRENQSINRSFTAGGRIRFRFIGQHTEVSDRRMGTLLYYNEGKLRLQ